ncbi:MAG TPA: LLM class flavin-dependent oxidoreductase [Dehalococcoidia bacterium]
MSAPVTFGVLPGHDESGDVVGTSQLAEALGFHSVWFGDHVLWYVPVPDPFVLLSHVAAQTERVLLGTGVYLAPLRPPPAVAKQAATLDLISGGRFIFGVGVGGENPVEYEASGVPLRERGRRLDETLEICRLLWSGERVSYQGRVFRVPETRLDTPPARPGGPPIWVGGRSEGALRRAGRLGDGWLAFVVTPERFAGSWDAVRRHAEAAGRNPDALTPALQIWCQLAPTEEEALAAIAPAMEAMYRTPYERFRRYTIAGTPEQWLERLRAFTRAGVRHFNLIFAAGDVRTQMLQFAEEVLPHAGSLT